MSKKKMVDGFFTLFQSITNLNKSYISLHDDGHREYDKVPIFELISILDGHYV